MDIRQINAMIDNCGLPCDCENLSLKETHISWIILSNDFAYKIKRPVKFTFLDFSTPAKRKHFCHEEVRLNRRLAPEMYLDVISITEEMLSEHPGRKAGAMYRPGFFRQAGFKRTAVSQLL
jgi:aminoglycoside phosphotransferase family enzyme